MRRGNDSHGKAIPKCWNLSTGAVWCCFVDRSGWALVELCVFKRVPDNREAVRLVYPLPLDILLPGRIFHHLSPFFYRSKITVFNLGPRGRGHQHMLIQDFELLGCSVNILKVRYSGMSCTCCKKKDQATYFIQRMKPA